MGRTCALLHTTSSKQPSCHRRPSNPVAASSLLLGALRQARAQSTQPSRPLARPQPSATARTWRMLQLPRGPQLRRGTTAPPARIGRSGRGLQARLSSRGIGSSSGGPRPTTSCTSAAPAHSSTSGMAEASGSSPAPIFTFGVISDVQYADIDDGTSFHGVPRFYRNALVALRRAMSQGWAAADFGIHFGDILDGFQPKGESEQALSAVLDAFALFPGRTYHMLGNHCLYNLPRARLNERLRIPPAPGGGSYYSFQPPAAAAAGLRFVVLDAYDVSLLGWPAGHPLHDQAEAVLAANNPNANKNSPDGLAGPARRYVKFGGGVGAEQLAWLRRQLADAAEAGENILVLSHLPLMPGSCPDACLLWNYEEVLAALRSAAADGTVVATVAGHSHQNGYLLDDAGIHHLVLPAVLETPPGRDAYGVVEVHGDRLLLRGADVCMSCCLRLTPKQAARQSAALARSRGAAAAAQGAGAAADLLVEVADEQQLQPQPGRKPAHQQGGGSEAAPQPQPCRASAGGS